MKYLFLAGLILSSGLAAKDAPDTARVTGFGPVRAVQAYAPIASDAIFSVAFDVSVGAETGEVNRHIESAARFLNMHRYAGLPDAQVTAAVVVHGAAVQDLLKPEHREGGNRTADLVRALVQAGASVHVCGQSVAFRGVNPDHLLPEVTVELSAMTAHAKLSAKGYSSNPF